VASTGRVVRFSCCWQKLQSPLRRSHDSDAADSGSPKVIRRARRVRGRHDCMLGEPISGSEEAARNCDDVVPEKGFQATCSCIGPAASGGGRTGTTRSYAATRNPAQSWSREVSPPRICDLDVAMEIYNGADAQRAFATRRTTSTRTLNANARIRRKMSRPRKIGEHRQLSRLCDPREEFVQAKVPAWQ